MFKSKIKYISFNTFNWKKAGSNREQIDWLCRDFPAKLSINYFEMAPDIPAGLDNIVPIIDFYREMVVRYNGGLIKVETAKIDNYQYLETIIKIPTQQGLYYTGSLTFPFKNCSYVIKIQATESGMSGVRESVILDKMLSQGVVQVDEAEGVIGWGQDPYLKDFKQGNLMNLAEKEEYDNDFPEHPLTLVRVKLREIKESLSFNKKLEALEPFSGA